jgi:hypothetical protein
MVQPTSTPPSSFNRRPHASRFAYEDSTVPTCLHRAPKVDREGKRLRVRPRYEQVGFYSPLLHQARQLSICKRVEDISNDLSCTTDDAKRDAGEGSLRLRYMRDRKMVRTKLADAMVGCSIGSGFKHHHFGHDPS